MNTQTIKLDINKKLYEKIIAKQGDTNSRFLLFHLLDDGVPFDLTEKTVRVYGLKADKKEIFNDLEIIDYEKGHCKLALTTQALAVDGTLILELVIMQEESKLTSIPFEIEVIKSINSEKAIESVNEFTALQNALGQVLDIDNRFARVNEKVNEKANKLDVESAFAKFNQGLNKKVSIVHGKDLSTNDYDDAAKAEVAKVKEKMNSTKGTYGDRFTDIYVGEFVNDLNGYTRLPNGLLLQWGYITTSNSKTVILPVAYANNNYSIVGGVYSYSGVDATWCFDNAKTSQFAFYASKPVNFYWVTIGTPAS